MFLYFPPKKTEPLVEKMKYGGSVVCRIHRYPLKYIPRLYRRLNKGFKTSSSFKLAI